MGVSKSDGSEKYPLWCAVVFIFFRRFITFLNSDFFLFIFFLDFDIFLSPYRFIMHYYSQEKNLLGLFLNHMLFFSFSYYCKSYDLWDLFFIHLIFLVFFSSPSIPVFDINFFLHGGIYHASTITGYVFIFVAFLTFNVKWGHISISCLNNSSICSTIYKLMSKVMTIKTMTIKETFIPGSVWSSLRCSPSQFIPWLTTILSSVDSSSWLKLLWCWLQRVFFDIQLFNNFLLESSLSLECSSLGAWILPSS